MRTPIAVLSLSVALASAAPARAEQPVLRPAYHLATDLAVTAVAIAGTLGLLASQERLAPASCRWCEPPELDARVTRALGWGDTGAASRTSDALQLALAAGVLGNTVADGYRRGDPALGLVNGLLVAEATGIAMFVDTGVKYAVGRARPYVWLGGFENDARDANLSFFSGHATFAFALAASSSTLLLSQHAPGAELASGIAFAGASAIGYLRIAADEHYLTDVLAGAAAGTLIGWAVPHFLHPARSSAVQLRPAPGGVAVSW